MDLIDMYTYRWVKFWDFSSHFSFLIIFLPFFLERFFFLSFFLTYFPNLLFQARFSIRVSWGILPFCFSYKFNLVHYSIKLDKPHRDSFSLFIRHLRTFSDLCLYATFLQLTDFPETLRNFWKLVWDWIRFFPVGLRFFHTSLGRLRRL